MSSQPCKLEPLVTVKKMESHKAKSTTLSVQRWCPTKEQITILENLYQQGLRTPNADQIQRITASLKTYGHIEGKNVFYWFQNHKARLRQKQKQKQNQNQNQHSAASFNPFLHTPRATCSSSLYQNVLCGPYSLQQNGTSYYSQQPEELATGGISTTIHEKVVPYWMPRMCNATQIYEPLQEGNRETLTLFPLHPTGILERKTKVPSLSVDNTDTAYHCSTLSDEDGRAGNQPCFDFLTSELQGSPKSD